MHAIERLFVIALVCTLWGCSAETVPAGASTNESSTRAEPRITDSSRGAESPYIGVASCAASGCHGDTGSPTEAAELKRPAWRTSFWEWKEHDPHARAYHTLLTQQSRDIVRFLDPQAADNNALYAAFLAKNCCGCHATGNDATQGDATNARPNSLEWGVQCEACHGPARDWLTPHSRREWTALSNDEHARLGLRDTRNVASRAKVCVECHIGSPDLPGREVMHDLLAGGHPRLQFEFTVYLANMPSHWDARPTSRDDAEPSAWKIGQLVAADQALSQLSARAQRATQTRHKGNSSLAHWPEYSEYDCFACHHDLNAALGPSRQHRSTGDLRWGNWYFSLSETWSAPDVAAAWNPLRDLMQRRHPVPGDVVAGCKTARMAIQAALSEQSLRETTVTLPEWTRQIAASHIAEQDWSAAAQWSLAVAACIDAHRDAAAQRPPIASGSIQHLEKLLHDLQVSLAFPRRLQGQHLTTESSATADGFDFDSPHRFDPTHAAYRQLLHDIRRELTLLITASAP